MRLKRRVREIIRKYRFDPGRARFHFIHIPKNAGISIRDALYLQSDVSLTDPFHYRYIDIADQVGRNLKFFAIVRNPWSRTASRYQFGKQNAAKWQVDDPRRKFIENATFSDFLREHPILPNPDHPGQPWMGPLSSWFNQLEWVRDELGRVACDCLRFENLEKDLPQYLQRTVKLRRRNVTRQRFDYRTMYTDEMVDLVANLFREDIAYFGFSFDGEAKRNVYIGD
jgi:hypothetical protein